MEEKEEEGKDEVINLKVTCVGDTKTGKTCLLYSFADGEIPTVYIPSSYQHNKPEYGGSDVPIEVDGKKYIIYLEDVPGSLPESLRAQQYPNTDVFLLVFSVVDPSSFQNAKDLWIPELQKTSKTTPIILVGNKADLLEDETVIAKLEEEGQKPIRLAEKGMKVKGCVTYKECSALKVQGVTELFQEAVRATATPTTQVPSNKKDKHRCLIV